MATVSVTLPWVQLCNVEWLGSRLSSPRMSLERASVFTGILRTVDLLVFASNVAKRYDSWQIALQQTREAMVMVAESGAGSTSFRQGKLCRTQLVLLISALVTAVSCIVTAAQGSQSFRRTPLQIYAGGIGGSSWMNAL